MPFDASNPGIVELDYNFERVIPGCKGRSPEPSEDAILEFQDDVSEAVRSLEGRDNLNKDKAVEEIVRLSRDEKKQISIKMFTAIAKVLQNQPTLEQMMELNQKSYRLGQAYMGSVIGDLLNPKDA